MSAGHGHGGSRLPRRIGQYASAADEVDWDEWWREWKAADRKLEAEFEASLRRPLVTKRVRGYDGVSLLEA